MVNIPIIQDIIESPLAGFAGGLGKGIGDTLPKAYENRQLAQLLKDINVNDPNQVQSMLNNANPMLRPQLAGLIQQQQSVGDASVRREREGKLFEQETQLKDLQIEDLNRAKDTEFSNLVERGFEGDPTSKGLFVDLSKKFADIKDPQQRFRKTYETYQNQLKQRNALLTKLDKIGKIRKGFLGLKDNDINALSKGVDKLIKDGIDPRLIEQGLKPESSGLSEKDYERIMTPNIKNVDSIISKIPTKIGSTRGGTATEKIASQFGGSAKMSDRQKTKTVKLATKAIKDGASLDYLYSSLIDKKYNQQLADEIIREALAELQPTDLTSRQELQALNLQRRRGAALENIFGG